MKWLLGVKMGDQLALRLKQKSFSSPHNEAMLNILVTAEHVSAKLESQCQEFGITLAQYNVLRILKGIHPNGHPRWEIIERMMHNAPDVTRLIDRLVAFGYTRRDKSEEDKRLSLTFITDSGIKLLQQMQESVDVVEREIRKRLSVTDATMLSALCERIYGDY